MGGERVICGKRVEAKVKGNVSLKETSPALFYVLQTLALSKRQDAELDVR